MRTMNIYNTDSKAMVHTKRWSLYRQKGEVLTREELLQIAKPILFNTEMVRAILEDRKTVTRRVVKPKSKNACGFYVVTRTSDGTFMGVYDYDEYERMFENSQTPPACVGDILYVRETWNICNMDIEQPCITYIYKASKPESEYANTVKVTQEVYEKYADRMCENNPEWKPSIHMPKDAARIFLKVNDVRVERLQDMEPEDAIREGTKEVFPPLAVDEFRYIWNSTIKKADIDTYGWDANPYVWVIEFERI